MPFYEERGRIGIFKCLHSLSLFAFWKTMKGGHTMLESKFQAKLIKKLKEMFEGCIVMKNDSGYIQGIPDLLVLYKDKWAALECKKSTKAKRQPNQEYYVQKMDEMSFSRFISPENEEEVLNDLQRTFRP
jgi:hypothetical protein